MKLFRSIIIGAAISLQACIPLEDDDCHRSIILANSSNDTIHIMAEDLDGTDLTCLLPTVTVAPMAEGELRGPATCWESSINQLSGGSITLTALNKVPDISTCDSTILVGSVIEQKEVTVATLQANGWKVDF